MLHLCSDTAPGLPVFPSRVHVRLISEYVLSAVGILLLQGLVCDIRRDVWLVPETMLNGTHQT
jgi:hypothetical protein